MQINFSIKVEKRHLAFLVVLICVLFVVGVSAYVNPTTHVGHDANETGPGTFGGTVSDTFIIREEYPAVLRQVVVSRNH